MHDIFCHFPIDNLYQKINDQRGSSHPESEDNLIVDWLNQESGAFLYLIFDFSIFHRPKICHMHTRHEMHLKDTREAVVI